jgi:hypothetical protein
MQDPYEVLVRWYLRFNGYLSVENFIIHEPAATSSTVPEGGEIDALAVRFPYSKEEVANVKQIKNDPKLFDAQAKRENLVDFVIAEVKGGRRSLSPIWRTPDEQGTMKRRIGYLLSWLGPFNDPTIIEAVASRLQAEHRAVEGRYLFRLVYFAQERTAQAVPPNVPQIRFSDIAEFIVRLRVDCWQESGLGVRSHHPQWDPLIIELWRIALSSSLTEQGKITAILSTLKTRSWLNQRFGETQPIIDQLLSSPMLAFDQHLRSALPEQHGIYAIRVKEAKTGEFLRAGSTKTASGGLRQRIYQNHLMGDQEGNLRSQLVNDGVCEDLVKAKRWIQDNCYVQILVIDRRWSKYFILSILRPRYCG